MQQYDGVILQIKSFFLCGEYALQQKIVFGDQYGQIFIYKENKLETYFQVHEGMIKALKVTENFLITSGEDQKIKIFEN